MREKQLEKAFQMYLEGASYSEIASYFGVTKRTVINWANKGNWKKRKKQILTKAAIKADQKREEIFAKIISDLEEVRARLVPVLTESSPRSFESGANIFIKISELLLKYRQEGQDVNRFVEIIFNILVRHPKVGPLLIKYKDEILQELKRELK